MKDETDIIIISPGLLETGTCRGGGCEVSDYNVAIQLSLHYNVKIISTFYKKYKSKIKINEKLYIENVLFPAAKRYPPSSTHENIYFFIATYMCSILIILKLINMCALSKNLKIIIVHNPNTALLPSIFAKIARIKIIYSEGNITPWSNPYISTSKKGLFLKLWNLFNLYPSIWLCQWADEIRAQSDSIKAGMIKYGIPSKKIWVIPAGVDLSEFQPLNENQL